MIDIQAPEKIKRGNVLKGRVTIDLDKEVKSRAVVVTFENMIYYPNHCLKNFSGWSFPSNQQFFSTGDQFRYATIPFEFTVPEEAPPTYRGKSLESRWRVHVKIDIPLSLDINAEKIVEVER